MTTTSETIHLYSVKGGQGTTTVAASLALLSARSGIKTAIVSAGSDLPAILGTTAKEVIPNLHQFDSKGCRLLHTESCEVVIVDAGLRPDGLEGDGGRGRKLLVTRGPCYLALKAAVASTNKADGVILLTEEGRALGKQDVEDVLGVPVIAEVPVHAAVARCIDAGLLASRLPTILANGLDVVILGNLANR